MNIAIIGISEIYCDSLSTLLNQIAGVHVDLTCTTAEAFITHPCAGRINIVFVDSGGDIPAQKVIIDQINSFSPGIEVLVLFETNRERMMLERLGFGTDKILSRNAMKKDFATRIRSFEKNDNPKYFNTFID
jgi:hypothetical protein